MRRYVRHNHRHHLRQVLDLRGVAAAYCAKASSSSRAANDVEHIGGSHQLAAGAPTRSTRRRVAGLFAGCAALLPAAIEIQQRPMRWLKAGRRAGLDRLSAFSTVPSSDGDRHGKEDGAGNDNCS